MNYTKIQRIRGPAGGEARGGIGGDRGGMPYHMQGGGVGYGGYGSYGGYSGEGNGGSYGGGMQQMPIVRGGQPPVTTPSFTPGSGPTPGQAYGGQPGGGSGAW